MGARHLLESVKFPMYSRRKGMGSLKPVREEPFEMMNGGGFIYPFIHGLIRSKSSSSYKLGVGG